MRKPIAVGLAAIMVLLGVGGGVRWLLREHWASSRNVGLADGSSLLVSQTGSQWRYFGHPHVFGFGGGGPWETLNFTHRNRRFTWHGPFIPVVLQFDGLEPVLVVYDDETSFSKPVFRYFRLNHGSWTEKPLDAFPRQLAIQNLPWLWSRFGRRSDAMLIDDHWIDQVSLARQVDPSSEAFRQSLTAKLWHCIEKREQFWQVEDRSIALDVLSDYKQKHLSTMSVGQAPNHQ